MFYFYMDESGSRGMVPSGPGSAEDKAPADWLYVLCAVSLFEHRWHKFEKFLWRRKREAGAEAGEGARFGLEALEIKSSWIRNPRARSQHPLLCKLDGKQLTALVDCFYAQLAYHNMQVFAVVVDKRHLRGFMDPVKLQRKATELLLERIEMFMATEHHRHQALIVADDTTRQENLALAEKVLHFQESGTSSGCRLKHISGLPMFTRSEFSNGIQLADLCAYNVYRAFRDADLDYPFFRRIEERIWRSRRRPGVSDGLKVFPDESPLVGLAEQWAKRKAPDTMYPGLT